DASEPCQPWGVSEARMARGIDAALFGQGLVMLQPAGIGLTPVQQYQGRTFPTPIKVDIYARNGYGLFPPVRCRHALLLGCCARVLRTANGLPPVWRGIISRAQH